MGKVGRRAFVGGAIGASALALGSAGVSRAAAGKRPPNIVFILVDDMGWGDIKAYNPHSVIPTPHLDRLVKGGMRFTDMHSSSALCTPSRYSLMTGRYPWRTRLQQGAFDGYDYSLIDQGRLTVAGLLKKAGYSTSGVGKWHMGLGTTKPIDYAKPFHPAPTDHGFDYYFGIPASLDMPPYLYFENDRALAAPTARTENHGVEGRPFGAFWRGGPMMPGFEFEKVVPTLTDKAVEVIDRHAKDSNPFFLYFALPSPHTPWLPLPEYRGKSGAGDYGDFMVQTDAMVGRLLDALDRGGIADDTLVMFASDNGAMWDEQLIDQYGHRSNADWRGRKSDVWEAGHRVPCLARWPGRVPAGSVSNEMLSLTDFMATVAAILGVPLPTDAAEDSFNMLPALEKSNRQPIRQTIIKSSGRGMLSIREGNWKLELGLGSGGFSLPTSVEPVPGGPKGQLYDLGTDPGELNNLWSARPEIVARLTQKLEQAKAQGRTRPG